MEEVQPQGRRLNQGPLGLCPDGGRWRPHCPPPSTPTGILQGSGGAPRGSRAGQTGERALPSGLHCAAGRGPSTWIELRGQEAEGKGICRNWVAGVRGRRREGGGGEQGRPADLQALSPGAGRREGGPPTSPAQGGAGPSGGASVSTQSGLNGSAPTHRDPVWAAGCLWAKGPGLPLPRRLWPACLALLPPSCPAHPGVYKLPLLAHLRGWTWDPSEP